MPVILRSAIQELAGGKFNCRILKKTVEGGEIEETFIRSLDHQHNTREEAEACIRKRVEAVKSRMPDG